MMESGKAWCSWCGDWATAPGEKRTAEQLPAPGKRQATTRYLGVEFYCVKIIDVKRTQVTERLTPCSVEFVCPQSGSKLITFPCPVCQKLMDIKVGSKRGAVWSALSSTWILPVLVWLFCGGPALFAGGAGLILGLVVTAVSLAWIGYFLCAALFEWEVGFDPNNLMEHPNRHLVHGSHRYKTSAFYSSSGLK
jgi:hypothetical protein